MIPGGAAMRHVLRVLLMLVTVEGALAVAAPGAGAHEEEERKISPTRDLTLPAAWAVEWRITTTPDEGGTERWLAIC